MKWEEARSMYVNKWILFEAIEAYSKEGKRTVFEGNKIIVTLLDETEIECEIE